MYSLTKRHKRATIDDFLSVQEDNPIFVMQRLSIHIAEEIMPFKKRIPVRNYCTKKETNTTK